MCACGCIIPLAVLIAVVYCFMHGMWIAGGLLVAVLIAAAWFGRKMLTWRPGRKPKP